MHNNYTKNAIKLLLSLFVFSIAVFIIIRLFDYWLFIGKITLFQRVFSNNLGNLTNSVGGLGEVVTAVLGVEITAVAIIVQLAANRYSDNVMSLFIHNKVNFIIVTIFVVTAINTILVTSTLQEGNSSYLSLIFTLLLIILSFILVIPHLYYVFSFLRPENFLSYVKKNTLNNLMKLYDNRTNAINETSSEIVKNIDFIGDVASNSVFQGDRATALLCTASLQEIVSEYIPNKKQMPNQWFKIVDKNKDDPDFAGYSNFVMQKIEERKVFLERKVFRAYDLLFNSSRKTLRDVASGILLNSELIGESAIKNNDEGVLQNVFLYFNSYLRFAITGKDPRSAFNTLEHYRTLAEKLLDIKPELVEDISFYFKYYGHEADKNGVLFIIETAAHDLCRVNELAYKKNVPNQKKLLEQFLNLDQPLEEPTGDSKYEEGTIKEHEKSLIGVRIAQVKLAAFYLINGADEFANMIFEDIKAEPAQRINKIKNIIFETDNEEFWEVNPRGINFYYLSEDRKRVIVDFFNKF